MLKVSIIIPFKAMSTIIKKCISHCQDLSYPNYDMILIPDQPLKEKYKKAKIITSGTVYPANKRNLAARSTKADICAFIDSDAYPVNKDWIKNAIKLFEDPKVGAVGGPNFVPEDSTLLEKAAADVVYSKLCAGGNYPIRKYKNNTYEYKEIASSNLFVRTKLLLELEGFDERQLTSEDSKLCFNIQRAGKKVIWSPDVAVYHHRRKLFSPHISRMFVEGRNKAFIIKEIFDINKLFYLLPSLFVLGLIIGFILSFFSQTIKIIYIAVILSYIALLLKETYKFGLSLRAAYVFLGILLTHLSYGSGFIKGILTNKYKVRR